jgi:hypothetical protein
MKDFILRFASKKLLAVVMAYSLIVLDGTSALTLDPFVVQAASVSLIAFIAGQSAVDFKAKQ